MTQPSPPLVSVVILCFGFVTSVSSLVCLTPASGSSMFANAKTCETATRMYTSFEQDFVTSVNRKTVAAGHSLGDIPWVCATVVKKEINQTRRGRGCFVIPKSTGCWVTDGIEFCVCKWDRCNLQRFGPEYGNEPRPLPELVVSRMTTTTPRQKKNEEEPLGIVGIAILAFVGLLVTVGFVACVYCIVVGIVSITRGHRESAQVYRREETQVQVYSRRQPSPTPKYHPPAADSDG